MHLNTLYALTAGQKVNLPEIYEEYFPLPFSQYITLTPISKGSKTYDLWENVINILKPTLDKNNIHIVQLGAENDPKIPNTYCLNGSTNINQASYLIKRALLHLSTDTFGSHLAGIFDKKLVSLTSNNYKDCVKPYFGSPQNQIVIEADRKGNKPSFSFDENPKTINTIKPEHIVESVCKLLNLQHEFPYKTVYFGDQYLSRWIEGIPDQIVDVGQLGVDTIVMRMDIVFNEEFLHQQILRSNVVIISNKKININLIGAYKNKIKEFIYLIDESHDPEYIKEVQKMGIKVHLHTWMDTATLNEIKLDYIDIGIIIQRKKIIPQDTEELKNKTFKDLYYQSNKFILSKGKIYQSVAAYIHDRPVPTFNQHIQKMVDDSDMYKELNHCWVLEKA